MNMAVVNTGIVFICKELQIDSDPVNLGPARRWAEAFAMECGFDQRGRDDIGLCLNEALANVMRHAYGGMRSMPIAIKLEDLDESLRITIRDWGSGVLPARRKPTEALQPGGVGMVCLKELMDEISFSPQTKGMVLIMIRRKRRPGLEQGSRAAG